MKSKLKLLLGSYALLCTCSIALSQYMGGTNVKSSVDSKEPVPQNIAGPVTGLRAIVDKYDLWRTPTRLRGANTWQRLKDHRVSPIYTCDDIKALAHAGANYLNASHPGILSEKPNHGRYNLEDDALKNLLQLVDCAGKAGMFVVVSYRTGPRRQEEIFEGHHNPSRVFTDEGAQAAWIEMWTRTAEALKDNPYVVGYDLMVEPDTGGHPERWNALAKRLISAIRAKDSRTPILLQGADGGDLESLLKLNARDFDPQDNQRVVFCLHQYQPNDYAQQTEGKWEYECSSLKDKKGKPDPSKYVAYSPQGKEELNSVYAAVSRWRDAQRALIAVNEFGVVRWAGGWTGNKRDGYAKPDADRFINDELNILEGLGVSHAIWKWDPTECQGDDDYNFLHGQLFSSHRNTPSQLREVIITNWRKNEFRPGT